MNWYKKAQSWQSSGNLETDVEESNNKEELTRALQANGVDTNSIEEIVFPNNEIIWTVILGNELKLIPLSFPYPSIEDPTEWVWNIANSGNAWQYVGEKDFNKEFWEGVGEGTTYYHGTSPENIDDILRGGLSPRDETRGMSNKGTGAAVFLSENPETAAYSYDIVLEVNLGAMKMDGYMPSASIEEDVEEGEYVNALAHKIGLDNFEYEVEQGMDPGTVILHGTIPQKYIRVYE